MHFPTALLIGPALLCLLSWYGLGSLVPRSVMSGDPLLDLLTRAAVGAACLALLLFGAGRVGLLDVWLLRGITFAFAGVALVRLRAGQTPFRMRRLAGIRGLFVGAVGVALGLDVLAASAPPTSADALRYHLGLPRLWLELGHVGDPFWTWEGFGPSSTEMLYAQGLAFGGGPTAGAIGATFAILCASAVYGFARELAGLPLAGAVAAFLFVLQGVVTWEATSAFVELALTFFLVLASWHALRFARAKDARSAAWLGVCCGGAAGSKYLGLVGAAIVFGTSVPIASRGRAHRSVLLAGCITVATAGAWYLRNLVVTGNPFYPFFFGGTWLTPFADHAVAQVHAAYGLGGSLWRLVLLPAELVLHGNAFDRGQYVGVEIFVLALLAVIVMRTTDMGVVVAGALVYIAAWWWLAPQARFLLPALGVLAAVSGSIGARWLEGSRRWRWTVLALLGATGVVWVGTTYALTRQLLPVTVGAESRTAFLQRLTGTYDALRAIRRRVPGGTLGLAGYRFPFNVPGRAVALSVPGFVPGIGRRQYMDRLRSLGIQWIVVGGPLAGVPELRPVESCLEPVERFRARYVTSRALGQGKPYTLVLFDTRACER